MRRLLAALALAAALACVKDRSSGHIPPGSGPIVVVYKAKVGEGQTAARGAKISVWAAEPDRLHAEIVAPVGGVTFTLDAGGGRVCIVDVGSGIAYSGDDGREALQALVGVPVSARDVVAALLHGVAPTGLSVARAGGEDGALPSNIRIADGSSFIALDRVRVDRAHIDASLLGTGVPPARLPVRSLEQLEDARDPRR